MISFAKASLMAAIAFLELNAIAFSNENAQFSADEVENVKQNSSARSLENVLSSMHHAAQELRSVQSEISYLTIEDPELINSRILRTGTLYYLQQEDRSYLRISFKYLQQDDFAPEPRHEEFLFNGVWLTRIDYKLKQVDRYQQADEDKPVDVFELISHNFPLVGFADVNSIEKDFEVSLAQSPADPNDMTHLFLNTRKDSPFSKEYSKIELWVDNNTFLPSQILAFSVQGDIHDIRFSDMQVNKNLKKAVFTIEKPSDFRENIEPLKDTRK